jgi:hypothetical protein
MHLALPLLPCSQHQLVRQAGLSPAPPRPAPQALSNSLWALAKLGIQPPRHWLEGALQVGQTHTHDDSLCDLYSPP